MYICFNGFLLKQKHLMLVAKYIDGTVCMQTMLKEFGVYSILDLDVAYECL